MSNKNTGVYELLYLKNGNTNQFFDYEVFLKLYEGYLSRFCQNESNNPLYMNVALLKEVVNGFEYYHDLFLGDVEVFFY